MPVKTGRLRQGIRVVTRGEDVMVLSSHRYLVFLWKGARPHIIRPRRARVLRFYWPKVGRVVYFTKVRHPGVRPGTVPLERIIEDAHRSRLVDLPGRVTEVAKSVMRTVKDSLRGVVKWIR